MRDWCMRERVAAGLVPGRWARRWPWTAWGCGAVGCAVGLLLASSAEIAAQRADGRPAEGAPLWISESRIDDARRLLIVVDPAGRHAALYHVDAATGTLALRSTRDITWDLMVDDFNAQEPKPAALRKMLQVGQPAAAER